MVYVNDTMKQSITKCPLFIIYYMIIWNKRVDLVLTWVVTHPLITVGFFPPPLDSSNDSRPFNGSKRVWESCSTIFHRHPCPEPLHSPPYPLPVSLISLTYPIPTTAIPPPPYHTCLIGGASLKPAAPGARRRPARACSPGSSLSLCSSLQPLEPGGLALPCISGAWWSMARVARRRTRWQGQPAGPGGRVKLRQCHRTSGPVSLTLCRGLGEAGVVKTDGTARLDLAPWVSFPSPSPVTGALLPAPISICWYWEEREASEARSSQ
jgi:hypothetical protein